MRHTLLKNCGSNWDIRVRFPQWIFPVFASKYLVETNKEYPVSFNGKMRFTIGLPLDLTAAQIEEIIMKDERTIKQLDGKIPNKVIIVPGKIINLVG